MRNSQNYQRRRRQDGISQRDAESDSAAQKCAGQVHRVHKYDNVNDWEQRPQVAKPGQMLNVERLRYATGGTGTEHIHEVAQQSWQHKDQQLRGKHYRYDHAELMTE